MSSNVESYGIVKKIILSGNDYCNNTITIYLEPNFANGEIQHKNIILFAETDCCDTSRYVIEHTKILDSLADINEKLKLFSGKTLVDIKLDIADPANLYYYFDHNDIQQNKTDEHVQLHYNKLIFSDGVEMVFLLVNESNGYYDGWTTIKREYKTFDKSKNNSEIMIIVGLPGSGKTTFAKAYKELSEQKMEMAIVFDDIVGNSTYNDFINTISNQSMKNIIITDPRFCIENVFGGFVNKIENFIQKEKIKIVLFENNKEKCLTNLKSREKNQSQFEKFAKSLNNLSKQYNTNNQIYKKYSNVIIPINIANS